MSSVAFSWSGDTIPTLIKGYLPTSRLHAPMSANSSRRARCRVSSNVSQAGLLQFVRWGFDAHGNYPSCFLNVPTLHPGGFLDNFMHALFHPGPASKCTVVSCRFHTSSLHLVVWVGWRCHWRAASVSPNPLLLNVPTLHSRKFFHNFIGAIFPSWPRPSHHEHVTAM